MRKISDKYKLFLIKKQHRLWKDQRRAANIRQNCKKARKNFKKKHAEYFTIKENREHFRKRLYQGIYNNPPITIGIAGDFGVEEPTRIDHFLETASRFIDFNNKELLFDLKNCTRMWPSAITLLCSLIQWVELSTSEYRRPRLASTASQSDKLNSYLGHCGFYDYVKRPRDTFQDYYKDSDIVKIQRETKATDIESREDQIVDLLQKYSLFSPQDIELFNCKILTEAFNNVTEHGVSHRDKGWWLLAQYHKTHGIISLCIADNGIGIRHSLMTGTQAKEIESKIPNESENDGKFIKMALEETVSGALEAPKKTAGFFNNKYASGSHRGNGLKRITDTCFKLKIPFSVLSHYGFAFIDENGRITRYGSMKNRVFAGTLNHFVIPARKELLNVNN